MSNTNSRSLIRKSVAKPAKVAQAAGPATLLTDVRALILQARESVAQRVNATLTMLHWQIGNRIRKDILNEKRAE